MSWIEKEYLRDNLPNNLENQKTSISINKNFSGKCKMKKSKIFKILFLVIVLYWLYALYSTHIKYYSGYVYEGDRPLAGVKVIEGERDNPVYTDNNGYFKLRKKESVINNYLI